MNTYNFSEENTDEESLESDLIVDETELDSSIGKVDKYSYRILMYSKIDVDIVEKFAIKTMLLENDPSINNENFISKAILLFPEYYKNKELKKRRGKKSSNYFIEEIGKWLWKRWMVTKSIEDRNNFVTYCYTLIDGVIFKYGRHKHGLSYEEIFQSAVIKIIQAMEKYDPERKVVEDDKGNPIYARIYTYFTMVLNYGITTITMAHGADKLSNVSYEQLSRILGDEPDHISDAQTVFQDFLIFLDSIIFSEDCQSEVQLAIYKELQRMLSSQKDLMFIANNLFSTIKERLNCKQSEIIAALQYLKMQFGPLIILTQSEHFRDFQINESD